MIKKNRAVHSFKILLAVFLICLTLLFLNACITQDYDVKKYDITYVYNNGNGQRTVTVSSKGAVAEPPEPERAGYIFAGWYSDAELTDKYYFGNSPDKDIMLYAAWSPDLAGMVNLVTTEYMTANVEVHTVHYKGSALFPTAVGTGSSGSGAIYKRLGDWYYLLTNYHVIDLEATATFAEYTVCDAYGDEYDAELLASLESYDIAVLRFRCEKELKVLAFDTEIPRSEAPVIALGHPKGQNNALTVGKLLDYAEIASKTDDETLKKVEFEVIWHSAYLNHGSSGGALISSEMKLIGLNYALSLKENDEFQYGFAIPAEKIVQFLNAADLY